MKISPLFTAAAIALTALGTTTRLSAQPSPQARVARLDEIVGLSADQKAKAADIFQREDLAIANLPADARSLTTFEIRQNSRTEIRALLTPAQQHIYDRTPNGRGGGLTIPTPQMMLEQLDREVGLTPAQKDVALQVFTEEFNSLVALAPADRPLKGMTYRRAAQDQIRTLLSPEQRAKQEGRRETARAEAADEQSAMEKALRGSRAITARIGAITAISSRTSSMSIDGQTRTGTAQFEVVGERNSATFVVAWERSSSQGPVTVTKITDASGQAVGP